MIFHYNLQEGLMIRLKTVSFYQPIRHKHHIYLLLFVFSTILSQPVLAQLKALEGSFPKGGLSSQMIPQFDMDTDSCDPSVAIGQNGVINDGLDPSNFGVDVDNCTRSDFLKHSNLYHRGVCSFDGQYCGHIFGFYAEKDETGAPFELGSHRHDWEHVMLWTTNGKMTHFGVSGHGGYKVRKAEDVPKWRTHPKVVYHKDNIRTHAMRFAKSNEVAENPYGRFVTPPIVSWFTMSSSSQTNNQLRTKLSQHDFGSAHMDIKDGSNVSNGRYFDVINRRYDANDKECSPGKKDDYYDVTDYPCFSAAELALYDSVKFPVLFDHCNNFGPGGYSILKNTITHVSQLRRSDPLPLMTSLGLTQGLPDYSASYITVPHGFLVTLKNKKGKTHQIQGPNSLCFTDFIDQVNQVDIESDHSIILFSGETIETGWSKIVDNYQVTLQKNGDFVVYEGGQVKWALSKHYGNWLNVRIVTMQFDGNLVFLNNDGDYLYGLDKLGLDKLYAGTDLSLTKQGLLSFQKGNKQFIWE